jgi:hypothetical protein
LHHHSDLVHIGNFDFTLERNAFFRFEETGLFRIFWREKDMSWATNIKSAIKSARPLFLRGSLVSLAAFAMLFAGSNTANAQAFTESFTTVTTSCTAPVVGWVADNNSPAGGTTCWFQSNPAVIPGQSGGAISANFNNTTGTNTISNWLMSPNRTFSNGDVITFYTRTVTTQQFPDRLQVRLSLAGTSVNVGTTATDVGDFTTLLLDINPTYALGVYPSVMTQFTITLSGLPAPTSGRIAFRYFVEEGGPTGDNSDTIGIDTFAYTPGSVAVPGDAPVDFNGDGKTDYVLARNIGGVNGQLRWFWNLNGSANPTVAFDWGLNDDVIISEDFDNDNKDDIAVWRPGAATVAAFYIFNSATSTLRVEAFGQTGDDPTVVDDYNNDGSADLAVVRRTTNPFQWYYRTTPGGPLTVIQWGQTGDFLSPGDYNGDGSADFGIQRPVAGQGQFWIRLSTGAVQPVVNFGLSSDLVVPGDWDGDGKIDIAVVRSVAGSRQWYYLSSLNGSTNQINFGLSTDIVAQGDYDGDGKTDAAIWRGSGTTSAFWHQSTTSGAVGVFTLGATGDRVPAAYNQD